MLEGLSPHDAAHRISAYTYGNISTLAPALFLALALLHLMPAKVSWYVAVLVLVGRLFSVGFVVARYRQESITFRTLLGGILFAVLGLFVAGLKAVLTH